MAIRETEKSLRAYFLIAGAFSALSAVGTLDKLGKVGGAYLGSLTLVALYIPLITRIVLGVAFIVAGVKLKAALLTGARWIKTMLVVSGVALFLNGALTTAVLPKMPDGYLASVKIASVVGAAIGLAITIYLHRSVTRLAAEAAARAGIAPPPPAARVV